MATSWYYQVMGEAFGPLTAAELRQHAEKGRVVADTFVRKGEDGRWVWAEQVNGLFRPARQGQSHRGSTPTART
jgi:hypothetical protein